MSPEQVMVWIGIVLAGWYGLAFFYNRRLGVRTYRWIQAGFGALSANPPSARWLGSSASGAQVIFDRPEPPFRRVELTFLLETRELLPLWIFQRLSGRRDRLFFKASLRKAPKGAVEVAPERAPLGYALANNPEWTAEPGPYSLIVAFQGAAGREMAARLRPFLDQYGPHIQQFSWGARQPHVLAVLTLTDLDRWEARSFFEALRALLNEQG